MRERGKGIHKESGAGMRIAIDSGGTFTDCVSLEAGSLRLIKVFSTPSDPSKAILHAIGRLAPIGGDISVRHGTTVGTNAMLERKGARVAFVTTLGFEDTISIGRQTRQSLYDLSPASPATIIPAELRFGVEERTTATGEILISPTEDQLDQLCDAIRSSNARAIALSLLFSFANADNERRVADALNRLGLPLSVSHLILPEFREYERASTVVVNAYLSPLVGAYLQNLSDSLTSLYPPGDLHVMQSSGGIISAPVAINEPVRTVLSGPAGGVTGAYRIAALAGIEKVIAFDMGGTSTDVSLIDGSAGGPQITKESVISGMPVAVPMLDIHTVGAGGGSLAYVDSGGILHVGPQSAGADPGPACYGRGDGLTVTDANLILGRLDPKNFLGGAMTLDEGRAREAVSRLAAKGMTEAFASGVLLLAETAMEKAIRVISVERGYDPREFTLLSFGGAGPLHACALARALSIPRVLVPIMPGALSAIGILLAETIRDHSKTVMLPFDEQSLEPHFAELEQRGREEFAGRDSAVKVVRSADLRYYGQGYELNVLAGASMERAFHDAHRKRYGYSETARPVEAVSVRVRFILEAEAVELPRQALVSGDGRKAILKQRRVYFGYEFLDTPVYAREALRHGDCFQGPALITEYSSTTVVPPGDTVSIDAYGNLLIEVCSK